MTKADLINLYGEQWYENFKARMRENSRRRYHENPEAERQRKVIQRQKFRATSRAYTDKHREVYRINSRDCLRMKKLRGDNQTDLVIHHMKYHRDNSDAAWIDDIVLITQEEHQRWHNEHPDFRAEDNIV